MRYTVDTKRSKKAYLQLYEALREDIVKGLFPLGSRLPSKRLLAEEAGVSVITVEHAYALLCDEGYVQSRERSGYYVSFRESDSFPTPLDHPLSPALSSPLSEAETHFPFSIIARTIRRVLSDYAEALLVKCPNRGAWELRQELSRYLARSRGMEAMPEQIIIGAGAEYLYGFLVPLLGRDRLFAIEDPSYAKIRQVYLASGARCESLPLGKDGVSSLSLARTQASVLHITPYRSFPSGVSATASKKREYLRWAKREGRYLVEDDFESEFTRSRKPEETLFSMAKKENVIYINTFSKTVAPSIRIGYMVLPRSLLPLFEERLGFYSCPVPLLEQLVLASLLASGEFERHINRVRRSRRGKKETEREKS